MLSNAFDKSRSTTSVISSHSLQCLVHDHDVKGFTRMKLLVTTLVFAKAPFGGHVCH